MAVKHQDQCFMNKKIQYISLIAAAVLSASCQEVDPLAGSELGTMGISSVTAAFTGEKYAMDPDANFSAQPDAEGNIVIEIPFFYPKSSDFEVTEELLAEMRVSATLATGTWIEPGLGAMNMTEKHNITAHDAAGRTLNYTLSAQITKLKECEITEFNVTSGGALYQGIINPGRKTISLMSTENELSGCTVAYVASPHSTVTGINETISTGDKITVTAHNGTDKTEYTVVFAVPEKIAYGARLNSQKNLWTKYFTLNYPGITMGKPPVRLASKGDNLYVLTNGTVHSINRKTGDYIGTVELPSGYTVNSMMNDEAGNIVFAADAASEFKVYYMEDFGGTPVELISYTNATGGAKIGNIRVAGDVKGNAVITATAQGVVPTGVVWTITGGVAGEGQTTTGIPGGTALGNGYNGCFAPVSSDVSDGVLAFGYWGKYDVFHSSNHSAYSNVYTTGNNGNDNTNCVTTASFNGARYCAIGVGAHFNYSAAPSFSVIDAGTPSAMSGALLYKVPHTDLRFTAFAATGATSDVLIVPSEDGYYMDVYMIDGNYDVITCYEFDCIQQ